jgi:Flp pilus assembly protein TadG
MADAASRQRPAMNGRRTPAARGRRPRADDRGSASIEFAITAVAVMAIMFTAIQAACWFWARSIALAAAQEGVDAQRAYDAQPGAGQARAQAFITSAGDGLNGATVTVTSDGQNVQATVDGHCLSVIPGFCNAFPVQATVHGTVERVTEP